MPLKGNKGCIQAALSLGWILFSIYVEKLDCSYKKQGFQGTFVVC